MGIDWADKKHAFTLQVCGESRIERGELEHTPEAIDQWASELARRFPGRCVAVALEQSRGALLFLLSKYAHLVLFPIHPNTLDHYRKSFYPSGAKSDPQDADLILDLLCSGIPSGCVVCGPIQWQRAPYSFWWKHGARAWTSRPVIAIA